MTEQNRDDAPPIRELGGYTLLGVIGQGGMGAVYRAHDRSLDRPVALKVLHPHLARDREFAERFVRERKTAARLDHPGVVQTYAAGEDHGRCYIAMQFVDGVELHRLMRHAVRLPLAAALLVVRDAADALASAHAIDVVHRDVKPSNVMITPDGRVKVMDFGLARARSGGRLTETGTYLGTPEYSAPEQCVSEAVDARADLYSLGVVLYEMLAGIVPHTGDTPYALFKRIVEEQPVPIEALNQDVPEPVRRLLGSLLAKAPADRPAGAREVVGAIDAVLAATPGGPAAAREVLAGLVRATREAASRDQATIRLEETDATARATPLPGIIPVPAVRSRRRSIAVLGALAVAAVAIAAYAATLRSATPPDPAPDPPPVVRPREPVPLVGPDGKVTVAVFDFQNHQGRSELEWMRVSLTEMLISNLTGCPDLVVLTRDRIIEELRSHGPEPSITDVAASLGAGLVVRGYFVPLDGDRVKVVVTIIRGDQHLPSKEEVGSVERIFRLVDLLSARVVQMIGEYRSEHDPDLAAKPAPEGHVVFNSAGLYQQSQVAWADRAGRKGESPEELLERLESRRKRAGDRHVPPPKSAAGSDGSRPANDEPAKDLEERRQNYLRRLDQALRSIFAGMRRAEDPGEQAASTGSSDALADGKMQEFERGIEYMESNRWATDDAQQLALQCYGQARAIVEDPASSDGDLRLARELLDLAQGLGHADPQVDDLKKRCEPRAGR